MPWDSRRYEVKEDKNRFHNRIMAYKTPGDKLVLIVTNRSGKDFIFTIDTGIKSKFKGYRYTPEQAGKNFMGIEVGTRKGPVVDVKVPDMTWEFWIEQ